MLINTRIPESSFILGYVTNCNTIIHQHTRTAAVQQRCKANEFRSLVGVERTDKAAIRSGIGYVGRGLYSGESDCLV